MSGRSRAIIIGAGPAGLTAALEFLEQTQIEPLVFEAAAELGGISKTVEYKGNRIDIGGHRFFSKSDRVMNWWTKILPIENSQQPAEAELCYQGSRRPLNRSGIKSEVAGSDQVMLVRSRLSRIFYAGKFFSYPVKLEWETLRNLGFKRSLRIGLSYLKSRLLQRPERSLEDFFINRFGGELYRTFFRDYTEKVWGVPCTEIAPDWGAQRVKGLSIMAALKHALWSLLDRRPHNITQKDVETSLIEYFLYPKLGPGQMWETVASRVSELGGQVATRHSVVRLHGREGRIVAATVRNLDTGRQETLEADYFLSTMPMNELIASLDGIEVPASVREVANGLPFRDFITVGLLVSGFSYQSEIRDNWIYIQDPQVKVGRIQVFNNWSPHMVRDPETVWLGLEYFVSEGDEFWSLSDSEIKNMAIRELHAIGLVDQKRVLDGTVLRVKKAYPAYFGTYPRFHVVRNFLDSIENLFPVGRNGMHRYNNQDHSMLTAMQAVENIRRRRIDKSNIWNINVDPDYHEGN